MTSVQSASYLWQKKQQKNKKTPTHTHTCTKGGQLDFVVFLVVLSNGDLIETLCDDNLYSALLAHTCFDELGLLFIEIYIICVE